MAGRKKSSDNSQTDSGTPEADDTVTAAAGNEDALPIDAPDNSDDAAMAGADGSDPVVAAEPGSAPASSGAAASARLSIPRHDPRDPPGSALRTAAAAPAADPAPADVPPAESALTSDAMPPERVEPARSSGGGFFATLMGGVIAGFIGFGIAWFLLSDDGDTSARIDDLSTRVEEQGATLARLNDQVAAGPDMAPVTTQIDELSARVDEIAGRVDGFGAQITELEKRPISEGVSEEAIAAYEAELDRMRAEIEKMVADAQAMRDSAAGDAQAALRRSALTRILSALDNGTPFTAALEDLRGSGQEIPAPLTSAAQTGVTSLAELRDTFPDAARNAIAADRSGQGGVGNIGSFLRNQLGARSLEPREGSDADAVLSRAEAALRTGRLGDALAELEALPEPAQAEMAGWIERAETRHQAVMAAEDLAAALNAG